MLKVEVESERHLCEESKQSYPLHNLFARYRLGPRAHALMVLSALFS